MSTLNWALFIVAAIFAGRLLFSLPRFWTGEISLAPDRPPSWWPWGNLLWRAGLRVYPVAATLAAMVIFALPLAMAAEDRDISSPIKSAAAVLGLVMVLGLLLAISIIAWNWPKCLVPTRLRDGPGLIAEIEGRR
jgi:hypothetical protein